MMLIVQAHWRNEKRYNALHTWDKKTMTKRICEWKIDLLHENKVRKGLICFAFFLMHKSHLFHDITRMFKYCSRASFVAISLMKVAMILVLFCWSILLIDNPIEVPKFAINLVYFIIVIFQASGKRQVFWITQLHNATKYLRSYGGNTCYDSYSSIFGKAKGTIYLCCYSGQNTK